MGGLVSVEVGDEHPPVHGVATDGRLVVRAVVHGLLGDQFEPRMLGRDIAALEASGVDDAARGILASSSRELIGLVVVPDLQETARSEAYHHEVLEYLVVHPNEDLAGAVAVEIDDGSHGWHAAE